MEKRSRSPSRALFVVLALALSLSLAACGGAQEPPQIVVVTATHTPAPVVQVVTATFTPTSQTQTFTPTPQIQVVTATFTPTPELPIEVQPSEEPMAAATTSKRQPALVLTMTPLAPGLKSATETPAPPTATPVPPTAPKPTNTPKARVSLSSYGVIYGHFEGGPETSENAYSVWLMRGDGSEAREVVRPGFEPAFSPSGDKFAYYRPFNGIWVYDLDKSTGSHIVASDYAEFASFSPNGSQLVFHEWVGNWWSADVNLYIVNADGSGRTQLLPQGIRPAWSPTGGLIAFDTCRGTSCGIYVVQPNGQGFRAVTSDGGGKVSWSPDGKKLVYSTEVDGDPEVWVVNVDGSGRKQLTHNNGNDTLPVYSPDGQYIYFLSDQNGKAWAIRVMRPDGSDVKTVRQVGVPPRWQFSRLWVGWW
jgi:hypothetical protein